MFKRKRLLVPDNRQCQVRALYDKYCTLKKGDTEARYLLWKVISEIFPNEDFINKNWSIETDGALKTIIKERSSWL